ncbi:YlbD family protein [Alteribacter aurantiacus]|uniref:YlbD family protein n=1 Tax=Alteribacter aurantiacus TaxID=254410 RepID=UPI00040763B1|nr:YlbD family protein [Alteribacter aurantiacus]
MGNSLHPDIQRFKAFVKENPYVLRDVKSKEKTLQDLYEEWALFGDDDPVWDTYKSAGDSPGEPVAHQASQQEESSDQEETSSAGATAASILAMIKSMNMNDLQNQLAQFNGALTSIQQLLSTFRSDQGNTTNTNTSSSPFSYKED